MFYMKNKRILGTICLFITAFIWGVAFVFQRTGMDHIGPITFMAARCVLAVVCLGILSVVLHGKDAFKFDKPTLTGGLICGVLLTFANNFQQIGLVSTSAGKAGFITAMYILLVPLVSVLIFKKRQSSVIMAAVGMGAVGLFLLCVNENFTINTGDLWVIACALTFTWHIIVTDKFAQTADPIKMSFLQFLVTTVLDWILAFIVETPTIDALFEARISILYCGILSAGAGYTLQIFGQRYTEPAAASLIMSLESVFAALSGALILGERMSTKEIIGCVIMFAAILLVEFRQTEYAYRRKERRMKEKRK